MRMMSNHKTYNSYDYLIKVFHFDISGKDNKDQQSLNISLISLTLLVFHFDISGKDDNDSQ